jgi:uncharacterized membrane protein
MNDKQLARGLGWFSIGLGLAEIFLPKTLQGQLGIKGHTGLVQAMGARELTSGLGILSNRNQPVWLWSRVVGDIVDLALLGSAYNKSRRNARNRIMLAAGSVLAVTALDVLCSSRQTAGANNGQPERQPGQKPRRDHTIKVITINRPPSEIYQFWRNFENLPRFMHHLRSVTVLGNGQSHWVAKGPGGKDVEWDAELVQEKTNELIAWRSLPGSEVENAGSVRFEPATGGRGTVVRVHIQYRPPGGALGRTVAKLFAQNPEKQIANDLLRLKQFLETGEVATTDGQPSGLRKLGRKSMIDTLVRA